MEVVLPEVTRSTKKHLMGTKIVPFGRKKQKTKIPALKILDRILQQNAAIISCCVFDPWWAFVRIEIQAQFSVCNGAMASFVALKETLSSPTPQTFMLPQSSLRPLLSGSKSNLDKA